MNYKRETKKLINLIIDEVFNNSDDEFDYKTFKKLLDCFVEFESVGSFDDIFNFNGKEIGEPGFELKDGKHILVFRKVKYIHVQKPTEYYYTKFTDLLKMILHGTKQQHVKIEKTAYEILT